MSSSLTSIKGWTFLSTEKRKALVAVFTTCSSDESQKSFILGNEYFSFFLEELNRILRILRDVNWKPKVFHSRERILFFLPWRTGKLLETPLDHLAVCRGWWYTTHEEEGMLCTRKWWARVERRKVGFWRLIPHREWFVQTFTLLTVGYPPTTTWKNDIVKILKTVMIKKTNEIIKVCHGGGKRKKHVKNEIKITRARRSRFLKTY